ncbi:hypothetical protein KY386_03175 [Candidatus Parcubacteria bacterium]|nr:hypothetical protein [Candidatus Parcubacteria bacterium]
MVCQNCRSSDIVKIQEQLYCINCGQLVAPQPAVAVKSSAVVKAAAAPVKATVAVTAPVKAVSVKAAKAKPVTVKAVKAAVAVGATGPALIVNHSANLSPGGTLAPASAPTALKRRSVAVKPKAPKLSVKTKPTPPPAAAAALDLRPKRAASKPIPPPGSRRHLSDLSVSQSRPHPTAASRAAGVAEPELPAASVPVKAAPTLRRNQSPLHFGAQAAVSSRYWGYAALAGLAGALPGVFAGSLSAAEAWRQPDLALDNLPPELITPAAITAGGLVLFYLTRLFASGAVAYGAAAALDGRSPSPRRWSRASLNRLGALFGLDLFAGLSVLAVMALELLLLAALGSQVIEPDYLRTGALLVGHATVVYLALGVGFSRVLAFYPAVLTSAGSLPALRQGWHLYNRRFPRVVLAGLGALVVNVLLWAAYALAAVGVEAIGGPVVAGLPAAAAGQFLLLSLFISLAMVFNTAYWLKVYRRIAS